MPVLENQKWEIFAVHVFKGETGEQACIAAGYAAKHARSTAARLSAIPSIQRRIRELQGEVAKVAVFDRADLLEEFLRIGLADANDLVRSEVGACRHCYGIGHQYQWRDEDEYADAVDAWRRLPEKRQEVTPRPEDTGGYGYRHKTAPNPACPRCEGDGRVNVRIMDTTKLSPQARALYAGIKQTKDGWEVKTHSKIAALEAAGRIIGAFEKDNEQQNKPSDSLIAALLGITRGAGSKIPLATAAPKEQDR